MGVSPWTQEATATKSPEGAKGKRHTERPVVPLGLAFPRSPYHGLTPVATSCRHFVAIVRAESPNGTKGCSHGRKPMDPEATATKSPEGAKGKRRTERPVVPLGLAFPRSPIPRADARGYILPPLRGYRPRGKSRRDERM